MSPPPPVAVRCPSPEYVRPSVDIPKPGEAAGQTAAPEKVAELLLDESGQPFPVAQTGGLCAKRFEVIADHLVQHALRGTARLTGRRRQRHAVPRAGSVSRGEWPEDRGFQQTGHATALDPC